MPDHGLEARATKASPGGKEGPLLPPTAVAMPIVTIAPVFAPLLAAASPVLIVPIAPVVAAPVILHHPDVRTHILPCRRHAWKAQ